MRSAGEEAELAQLRRDAALGLIESHDKALRRTARRFSSCADDAEDAYQRAIEILLRKAPLIEPERLIRWMHTVTRHEAYAVRRQRGRGAEITVMRTEDGDEIDAVELIASDAPEPIDGTERNQRLARSREALRALKPNEVRALTLKAEGYSYREIGWMTGWTKTKINRLMVEGRRRFLDVFADIEEGRRCEQLAHSLSEFADGELSESDRPPLLEHLGQCTHCRAKLRSYRGVPQRVLALAPASMLAAPSALGQLREHLAAGFDRAREATASLLHRGVVLDASQAVASGGGSRGSGLALIGVVCGIGAAGGGAAVCVEEGVIDNPFDSGKPAAVRPNSELEAALAAPAASAAGLQTAPQPGPAAKPPRAADGTSEFAVPGKAVGRSEFGAPAGAVPSRGSRPAAAPVSFGFER